MTDKQPNPPQIPAASLQEMLDIPWMGMRSDLVLHQGPIDYDGQRSWVLEDPLRGNNYRLGHAEGELLYRLMTHPTLDAAVKSLYGNTTLRPSVQEIILFVKRLQSEHLAILPPEHASKVQGATAGATPPSFFGKLMQGNIFFRIPLLRPDAFLTRTLPAVSLLWSMPMRILFGLLGIIGLMMTLQEIEIYINTVNFLFTPQGALLFFICLTALKVGHEFAHAYTAKAMGLHIRSMGILFIVVWPLLYTDTTDAWKIPQRNRRMLISAAGVFFELAVGGIALFWWAYLPDGIWRSLMFFLSGTSLVSSVLVNLNPFMRYDGYYVLMDLWGIDNLRPRAFALLRYTLRRWLLDWRGPAPEFHPHQRALIIYGFLAMLYRLFIGISIAVAVYYLLFPVLGILIFMSELWLFVLVPLISEIRGVLANRRYLGSKRRLTVTAVSIAALLALLIIPMPSMERLPALMLYKEAVRIEAPADGRIEGRLPAEGQSAHTDEPLMRIRSDDLDHQIRQVAFDLDGIRTAIKTYGSGGEQGAYRNWLLAEEKRLLASLDKFTQASAQLDIQAPVTGKVMHVNQDLYAGAFVAKGTYLMTISDPDAHEIKAFAHESRMESLKKGGDATASVRFVGTVSGALTAHLTETSPFPVHSLPNESLFDFAGGPIASVSDNFGRRPKSAYFAFTFEPDAIESDVPHGTPCWVWLKGARRSILGDGLGWIIQKLMERGFF